MFISSQHCPKKVKLEEFEIRYQQWIYKKYECDSILTVAFYPFKIIKIVRGLQFM